MSIPYLLKNKETYVGSKLFNDVAVGAQVIKMRRWFVRTGAEISGATATTNERELGGERPLL